MNSQQPVYRFTKIKSINTDSVQTNMKAIGDVIIARSHNFGEKTIISSFP